MNYLWGGKTPSLSVAAILWTVLKRGQEHRPSVPERWSPTLCVIGRCSAADLSPVPCQTRCLQPCPLSLVQNPHALTLGVDSFLGARSVTLITDHQRLLIRQARAAQPGMVHGGLEPQQVALISTRVATAGLVLAATPAGTALVAPCGRTPGY
jgi:hypothetical protein